MAITYTIDKDKLLLEITQLGHRVTQCEGCSNHQICPDSLKLELVLIEKLEQLNDCISVEED